MSRTLIGIVSYGGLSFLEIALRSIQQTMTRPAEVLVIVAKPGDSEMQIFLDWRGIPHIVHGENKGFPASINDLLDAAFVKGDYAHLICMGNDVVPMPGALDAMINTALTTDWEMVCGSEFDSRFLVANYPDARKFFHGPNNEFTDFSARPWEMHKDFHIGVEPDTRKDIRNLTLFKRSVFEKVGYADVNYWPNGYFEDNQYCLRCDHLGISACGLKEAVFFHFWSRTIHQGESRPNGKYFERNSQYHEEWLCNPVWKIESREKEDYAINKWRTK